MEFSLVKDICMILTGMIIDFQEIKIYKELLKKYKTES